MIKNQFEAVRIQPKNGGKYSKIGYYYTRKNGQKVMIACRDINAPIVTYYVALWIYKYPSIEHKLIEHLRRVCLHDWFDVKNVHNVEAVFNDM